MISSNLPVTRETFGDIVKCLPRLPLQYDPLFFMFDHQSTFCGIAPYITGFQSHDHDLGVGEDGGNCHNFGDGGDLNDDDLIMTLITMTIVMMIMTIIIIMNEDDNDDNDYGAESPLLAMMVISYSWFDFKPEYFPECSSD